MEIGIVSSTPASLMGWEIHGFRTMEDLDIKSIKNEAKSRWLRPNEIHAILSNSSFFTINVKPVNLPKSGTILLFDRKMLRNFRKDGHNWKKKKDGKTVKEAHEHLKVGSEERIHVYYAHGQDNPNFVRRCYWLLDKALEHIVLVHYHETQGSPAIPVISHSGSDLSDLSGSRLVLEETDSGDNHAQHSGTKEQFGSADYVNEGNHAMRLHEINTLDWDELVVSNDRKFSSTPGGDGTIYFRQSDHYDINNLKNNGNNPASLLAETLSLGNSKDSSVKYLDNMFFQAMTSQLGANEQNKISEIGMGNFGITLENSFADGLQAQDSFGRWMNDLITDAPEQLEDPVSESSVLTGHRYSMPPDMHDPQTSILHQIFSITDVSPSWALVTEETKILIIGFFYEEYQHLANSTLYCICGEVCIPAEVVQAGVFRCLIPPQDSGSVNFYLTIDCCKPISQVLSFEFRPPIYKHAISTEDESNWEDCRFQIRLACLLFSTSKGLGILSSRSAQTSLKEVRRFILKTSSIAIDNWEHLIELIDSRRVPLAQAKESLLEMALRKRLNEWLLERFVDGSIISERDKQGQGVLHLCAILGYTWAVYPFSLSALSLDFRDKFGWTALHWAAYYGREHMVAALLSAGAKANLVTDPTSENPGGCTAADLAFGKGHQGLAAYLSEKALVQQFKDMKMAGNASGSLETAAYTSLNPAANEEETYLQETLAAYRTAADAAARIQSAFREHSLKLQRKAVQFSNPEIEARNIIAAMKIQHAFRNYGTRKKMAAAAHIQYRFRTWKLRKVFLNKRCQAIKIQAAFRGFQVRKQYKNILWSVGVLEKAILRWRLKRKGFRGLPAKPPEPIANPMQESVTEEDFFRASRRQAEEHVENAVVRVQAMFRSKRAQVEYRRMKLAHDQAKIEYDESIHYQAYLQ